MPKRLINFILIIFFVFCSAEAFAAQTLIRAIYTDNGNQDGSYLSTPKNDEIYLPNKANPANYRIHSNYSKNTDACASCHATHTAVGNSLLQWYDNYQTCMACHDGTVTTTYNVETGVIPNSMQSTSGGAFGNGNEDSLSFHNVTGGVLIGSAPGNKSGLGNRNNKSMGCESCHSPHGLGGNARLLNPDPNGVQSVQSVYYINYPLQEIGVTYINTNTVDKVIYAAYPKDANGDFITTGEPLYMLNGYPYKVDISINGEVNNENYTINNSAGYTKVYIYVSYINGGAVQASFTPSLRVRMNISNFLGVGGPEKEVYRDGLTTFCSACHGDYMDMSVGGEVYRHPVDKSIYSDTSNLTINPKLSIDTNSDLWKNIFQHKLESNGSITCLTCHYAHGTSSDFWVKNAGYTPELAKETEGSSALKTLPNGDLCNVCHNTQGYNVGTTHSEQPYATNADKFTQSFGISSYVGNNFTSCDGSGSGTNVVKCHTPIVNDWSTTLHRNSLEKKSATNDPIINGAKLDFSTENGAGISINDVVYVIGSKWTQRYVYLKNNKLAVAQNEYNPSNGWQVKPSEDDFIIKCAGCHVTGLNTNTGTWTDNGIACEACHGSAGNHVIVPNSDNITNPRYLSASDQTDICAQCHTLGFNKSDSTYPYPIGYMPNAKMLRDSVTRSSYVLNNFFTAFSPADLSSQGNFYSENILSSTQDSVYAGQEFNDFVQSKHYKSNIISCTTCHSSHVANYKGQMLKTTFEQTCYPCHGTSFDINAVMPKRAAITDNPADNLRVHTFDKQHSTGDPVNGAVKLIH